MCSDLAIADRTACCSRATWRNSVLQTLPAIVVLSPLLYIQLPQRAFLSVHIVVEAICMTLAMYAAYQTSRACEARRNASSSLAIAVLAILALDILHLWFIPWGGSFTAQAEFSKAIYLWLASRVALAVLLLGMPFLPKDCATGRWACRTLGAALPLAAVLTIEIVLVAPDVLPFLDLPRGRLHKLWAAGEYAFAGIGALSAYVFLCRAREGYECQWSVMVMLGAAICEWWLTMMFGSSVMSFPLVCLASTFGFMLAYFALFVPRDRAMPEKEGVCDAQSRRLPESGTPHAAIKDARALLDASIDPIFFVDMRGRIVDAGKATEAVTGMPLGEMSGKLLADCFSDPQQVLSALRQTFRLGEVRDLALSIRHRGGRITEVICSMTLYRASGDMPQGVLVVARDVTELRQYETQLLFQATCDALTALPNRLMFRERLAQAMADADRTSGAIGVMFIDLDNFKDVNETLGHAIGDELLQTIAIQLNEDLLPGRTVARLGGDEFAVLIERAVDIHALENLAHLLRRAIGRTRMLEGREVAVTCSIGITLYPADGADVDRLLRNADTAMYKAKEDGRNRCRHFTAEMNDRICRRVEIGNCLRHALETSELSLRYQPRASLVHGGIVGMEALLRWQSAELGAVSPGEFIPIAEANGTIVPIGEWVMHEACVQARQWQLQSGQPISIAVNLSARQFRDIDVIRTISSALERSGLPSHLLEIELTESMLMQDVERVANTLAALKRLGIRIAVDDFGTGYSSLNYLKSFPLDYLKIDRSFINDVTHDANDEAIVRAMIAMSHSLGILVIAEGVETAEQLAFLLDQGCDEIQGYFFSKPLSEDDALSAVAQSRRLECVRAK